jgi:hypothetical protein
MNIPYSKEYLKEYNHKYYLENKDKIKDNVNIWQNKNLEKVSGYKKKYENSEKKKINNKNWIENNKEKHQEIQREYKNKYKENNNQKIKAQKMARQIPLKSSCNICKSNNNLQRHHWDYDRPLIVNTLCSTCHKIQHIKDFDSSIYRGGNSFGR